MDPSFFQCYGSKVCSLLQKHLQRVHRIIDTAFSWTNVQAKCELPSVPLLCGLPKHFCVLFLYLPVLPPVLTIGAFGIIGVWTGVFIVRHALVSMEQRLSATYQTQLWLNQRFFCYQNAKLRSVAFRITLRRTIVDIFTNIKYFNIFLININIWGIETAEKPVPLPIAI